MTMAKGIANGFPLGATITTSEIADALVKNSISTFGGNPVSCAAANTVIEIIERDDLIMNCEKQGKILREGLEMIQKKYPKVIGDVRGMGLMQAIELVVDETKNDRTPDPKAVDQLMEETKKRHLLIGRGGLHGNVIRISPALNVTEEAVREATQIFDDAFNQIGN
jgi:4-aminobutyrate aminotransferase-like enzyme